jgi:dsDNA-specific endonuclease/ATPase MutS2
LPTDKPFIEKPQKKHGDIVELDLHSSQLLDSTAGMDNTAILQYQLDTFRKTIEQHKNRKGQKIVVIHGKGEGVLRNAIIQELKTHYKHYLYQDASFREYGFGATMITIH